MLKAPSVVCTCTPAFSSEGLRPSDSLHARSRGPHAPLRSRGSLTEFARFVGSGPCARRGPDVHVAPAAGGRRSQHPRVFAHAAQQRRELRRDEMPDLHGCAVTRSPTIRGQAPLHDLRPAEMLDHARAPACAHPVRRRRVRKHAADRGAERRGIPGRNDVAGLAVRRRPRACWRRRCRWPDVRTPSPRAASARAARARASSGRRASCRRLAGRRRPRAGIPPPGLASSTSWRNVTHLPAARARSRFRYSASIARPMMRSGTVGGRRRRSDRARPCAAAAGRRRAPPRRRLA